MDGGGEAGAVDAGRVHPGVIILLLDGGGVGGGVVVEAGVALQGVHKKVKISFHSFLGNFFRELEKNCAGAYPGGGLVRLKLVIKNQPTADTNEKSINSSNSSN